MDEPSPRTARRRLLADSALAAVITLAGLAEVWLPLPSAVGEGSPVASSVVVVLLGGAIAVRRVRPTAVLVVVVLVAVVAYAAAPVYVLFWGGMVPIMLAVYTVARQAAPRLAWSAAAATAALLVALELVRSDLLDANDVAFRWVNVAIAFTLGRVLHRTAAAARTSALEARAAEESAERATALARLEERARIAREMHDVVAHSVSVMVVQAGAAQAAMSADPDYTREALNRIRSTGTEALEDMRRVLTVLRDDEAHDVRPPQPGLARLHELLEQVDETGTRTELDIEGQPFTLPGGLDHTAYRIVQEALTNVRRHAGAKSVTVRLRFTTSQVEVEIVDDGRGSVRPIAAGHGIMGMRERVGLYGGELEVGPSDGGFRVLAKLPLEGS